MASYAVLYSGYQWYRKLTRWRRFWEGCGLVKNGMFPIVRTKEFRPYGYVLKVSLPYGLSEEDFLKKQLAIEQFLNRRVKISYRSKNILIEVYERPMEKRRFEVIHSPDIIVGIGHSGPVGVRLDLENPHMLIAGETGSGKSTALRAIITNILLTKNMPMHLIDLKCGAEFSIFKDCRNVKSFCASVPDAKLLLSEIRAKVQHRYQLISRHKCVDVEEYNKTVGYMPHEVVVIDEFSLLRSSKKDSIPIVEDLAAVARAAGVHLIVSTQRPDAEVINGRIKANFNIVLGLKTKDKLNSNIIIGSPGLEGLTGTGHGLLRYRGDLMEIQTMNLQPDHARELVEPLYVSKEEKVVEIRQRQ